MALILVVGCVSESQVNSPVSTTPYPGAKTTVKATAVKTTVSASPLQLVESHTETGDYGSRYVVGSVKNNGDKTYNYVQITINEYDDSGAQVGSTLANVNNLEPGGIWKFKAYVIDKEATNFKVKEITGW
ncbi:MAG: FxLYD domain-containing protein [Methanoregula sp.]